MKIDGVKAFSFKEMQSATGYFNCSSQVGHGGYGKVYKGILSDNSVVAIKRAEEGSLQGQKEFLTEIHLLSRVHHRNLVSLIGYCDEEGEQVCFLIAWFLCFISFRSYDDLLGLAIELMNVIKSCHGLMLISTFKVRQGFFEEFYELKTK